MKELFHLDRMLLRNPLGDWLTAAGFALVLVLLVFVIKPVLVRRLSRLASRTETLLDDALVNTIQATNVWLVSVFAVSLCSRYLDLPQKIEKGLAAISTSALFLQGGLWLSVLLQEWLTRSRTRAMAAGGDAATRLAGLGYVIRIALWAVILLLLLDNLGINITALVASLGIGGVAMALAVQSILGDLLASFSIVIDKPFVLGDFIIVDAYMGSVEHIGLKTTRIRSLGGELIVFSNSDLLKSRVRNYKLMRERRNVFTFGVLYQTTAEQLERIPQIVRRIVEAQPLVRFDRAHFKEFGDSAYSFEVVYWMLDPDYNKYMDTQQAINLAMVREFNAAGIGFAFPSRSLYIEGPLTFERQRRERLSGSSGRDVAA
jgi:small-conductance mechanosensitive channel